MFPERRLRRLRKRTLQPLFKETRLAVSDLVMPLFFDETIEEAVPIGSIPGQYRYMLDATELPSQDGYSAQRVAGL